LVLLLLVINRSAQFLITWQRCDPH